MIELLGARSVLAQPGEPSHEVTWDAVRSCGADLLFAACCGFDARRAAVDLPADLMGRVDVLDGYQLFSRPSPALLDSLAVLAGAIGRSVGEAQAS